MTPGFVEKLIARMDRLDPESLQTYFLRMSREKGLLETIFHAIQEGIVVLDGDGHVAYANRAAGKLLGVSVKDMTGQPIQRYVHEIDWEGVMRLDVKEWSRLVSREIEITYPEHRFVVFYVVPLAMVNAAETGAVVILRDVTHDREHEAKTIESERLNALMLLAAGMAHEIGNPLNSLNIHLQLIAREVTALPETARENLRGLLDVTQKEVKRLDGIISQFLQAIRPAPLKLEPTDVRDVLQETLDFLKHEVRDRDVLVEVELPDGLPAIPLDRQQIRQAFFNIIRNAIQAMTNGGLLKIGARTSEQFLAITFKDTGPGITPERLANMFEPFSTTKADGSGLGLMIVQRIVRDHGGQLEIHSEPHAGTTFTLLLPREEQRIRLLAAPGKKTEARPS
jgi:PAS domain S-box-containing protein